MKRLLFLYLSIFWVWASYAQLTSKHNMIRPKDEVVKQQVEYKDPGRSGENVVWNFSKLKPVNDEYSVNYRTPRSVGDSIYVMGKDTVLAKSVNEDDLVVGIEHRTMYYYRLKSDTLYCSGHENSTTLLQYEKSIPALAFPFNYKSSVKSDYSSKAVYSGRIDIFTEGEILIEADSYGNMILPSGDTLNNVLRVKTTQTYIDIPPLGKDSVEKKVNMLVENFKWYVKGYRYPVFETIHTINMEDQQNPDYFKTAFFYPPQEHFYLADDQENLAVIDSLWNEKQKHPDIPQNGGDMQQGFHFSYNYYPNPVVNDLHIEYMLEEDSQVNISVYDMQGREVQSLPQQKQSKGLYNQTLDCYSLTIGSYILRLKVNNEIVNEKIIKK